MRATLVFPVPRLPAKRYACDVFLFFMDFSNTPVACCFPLPSAKLAGRYVRYRTPCPASFFMSTVYTIKKTAGGTHGCVPPAEWPSRRIERVWGARFPDHFFLLGRAEICQASDDALMLSRLYALDMHPSVYVAEVIAHRRQVDVHSCAYLRTCLTSCTQASQGRQQCWWQSVDKLCQLIEIELVVTDDVFRDCGLVISRPRRIALRFFASKPLNLLDILASDDGEFAVPL